MTHSIYWIKGSAHTDITTQGYVGRTEKPVLERVNQHKMENSKVGNYMKRHNTTYRKVKSNLTLAEAKAEERRYRPRPNIGLNERAGG